MKCYPPRPWFIYPANLSQLWVLIPICLFLCVCNGGIPVIFLIVFCWICYQTNKAEESWRYACDHNMEYTYVSSDYASDKGYVKIGNKYYYLTNELKETLQIQLKERNNKIQSKEKEVVYMNYTGIPYVLYTDGSTSSLKEYEKFYEERKRKNEKG